MRMVIQRVQKACVTAGGELAGEIGKGFLVLVGICGTDDEKVCDKMLKKLIGLRIFEDEKGKTNLSLKDVGGELLLVSQFTLYADCRRGNRPGFSNAAGAEQANALYEYLLAGARQLTDTVRQGVFGAHMEISLVNDGPFTIILDSEDLT